MGHESLMSCFLPIFNLLRSSILDLLSGMRETNFRTLSEFLDISGHFLKLQEFQDHAQAWKFYAVFLMHCSCFITYLSGGAISCGHHLEAEAMTCDLTTLT